MSRIHMNSLISASGKWASRSRSFERLSSQVNPARLIKLNNATAVRSHTNYSRSEQFDGKLQDLLQLNWSLSKDKKVITKTYEFKGFLKAWVSQYGLNIAVLVICLTQAFLTQVAMISHQKGHHADIYNKYNKVTLSLHTDDCNDLTDLDLMLASRFDKLGGYKGHA